MFMKLMVFIFFDDNLVRMDVMFIGCVVGFGVVCFIWVFVIDRVDMFFCC